MAEAKHGLRSDQERESSASLHEKRVTKEEQLVGLIFQVTMWAYIAAAAAYVVIG
jgi:hypothetical protein